MITITLSNKDEAGIKNVVWVDNYGYGAVPTDDCTTRAQVKLYPGNGVPAQIVTSPANCNVFRTWVVGCFDSSKGLQSFVVKNVFKGRAENIRPADECEGDMYPFE